MSCIPDVPGSMSPSATPRSASGSRAGTRKSQLNGDDLGALTSQILALRDHLVAESVTLVVMEATGDYWKPFYYLLEDGPFEVMLVNARHVKNLPGERPTSQTPRGSPSSAPTDSSEARSSHLNRSASFVTSPARAPRSCASGLGDPTP